MVNIYKYPGGINVNGFKQIKSFYTWVFNTDVDVRQSHISLYMFLLNQNNRSNWVEWFKCPFDLAMAGACIGSRTTYYNCLNDLQKWKLLKYKKGVNNFKAPQIKLMQLYDNEQLTGQASVPLSEQVSRKPQFIFFIYFFFHVPLMFVVLK